MQIGKRNILVYAVVSSQPDCNETQTGKGFWQVRNFGGRNERAEKNSRNFFWHLFLFNLMCVTCCTVFRFVNRTFQMKLQYPQ